MSDKEETMEESVPTGQDDDEMEDDNEYEDVDDEAEDDDDEEDSDDDAEEEEGEGEGEGEGGEEEEGEEEEGETGPPKTYLPGKPLEEGEELVCDENAYIMYHQANTGIIFLKNIMSKFLNNYFIYRCPMPQL
jgi:hypothetical protein